jgi:hypothetical protein
LVCRDFFRNRAAIFSKNVQSRLVPVPADRVRASFAAGAGLAEITLRKPHRGLLARPVFD